jgi:GTPase SAR1 family protein
MEGHFNLAELAKKALHEAIRERGRVNVLIAGRTGVGKSTLVNALFQGSLATTGQGRPVTPHAREIFKEDVPLSVFDTRGLEMADFPEALRALQSFVAERQADRDGNKHVHVAWVCIAEDLRRVEEAETRLAEALSRHMPVVAVVTKARSDQGFRAVVQELLPAARNVVRVRAIAEFLDDGHEIAPMGLRDLVGLTMELVPEAHRRALAAAQKVDLALKRQRSHLPSHS